MKQFHKDIRYAPKDKSVASDINIVPERFHVRDVWSFSARCFGAAPFKANSSVMVVTTI